MITLSLQEISDILQSPYQHAPNSDLTQCQCIGISTDTRTLNKGNVFLAIVGDTHDGHEHIQTAIDKGASAIIASKPHQHSIPTFMVPDTTLAMGQLASAWLARHNIPVLAITGSSGKTTTRNLLEHICRQAYGENAVLGPVGNFNNAWGVPLTLFKLNTDHKIAVIEMGMDSLGEIDYLSQMCAPDAALITNAMPVHLAKLGSLENIAKAKGEIYGHVKTQGTSVINISDDFSDYWRTLIKSHNIMTFSTTDQPADIYASNINVEQKTFVLHVGDALINVKLQLQGKHNINNAIAASALASAQGIDLNTIALGLAATAPFPGRLVEHQLTNNIILIDDTYNAAPMSVRAAAQCLAAYSGKRIFVLGDMKELGREEQELHAEIGQYLKSLGIDALYTYGDLAKHASDAFGAGGKHFADQSVLIEQLEQTISPNNVILFKGSHSMHMEKVLQAILNTLQETQP